MTRMQTLFIVISLTIPVSGCCGTVKDAVKSYSIAVDGAAQGGAALVAECANAKLDAGARVDSCTKAQEVFKTIMSSAKQLQDIK